MLERIQKIENIGSYSQTTAGGLMFAPVTVIYGENRNGKSTLCDIFYSLSLNNPQLVLDRKSIIRNQQPDTINPKVELKFSGRQQAIKFQNSQWDSQPPEDSNLYIFDHGFIHRNVMAGSTYSRENSVNVSGFILGENIAAFEALEARNQKLRADKRTLSEHKRELEAHEIGNFNVFVTLPKPTQTLGEFDVEIRSSKRVQEALATQIANITQVSQRASLNDLADGVSIADKSQTINKCLALSMDNVHEASKAVVTAHRDKVNHKETFNGWAASGVTHLDEDCPFCGQELAEEAQELINSYRTAFDEEFQRFVTTTKTEVTRLRSEVLIHLNIKELTQKHEQNIATLATYTEDLISRKIVESELTKQLNERFESVAAELQVLTKEAALTGRKVQAALTAKYDAPYNAVDPIEFDNLETRVTSFNESLQKYLKIKEFLNAMLIEFKESQDAAELKEKKRLEIAKEATVSLYRTRLNIDNLCVQYNNLKVQIETDQIKYNTDEKALEQTQEVFLDTYFVGINTLFTRIGSTDFEISRNINRGGTRTVYDLEVKFKGQRIDNSKLYCLFSESDRRALALCIFLAKIQQLPDENRAKAVLVMDDPVTSFDSERISSILLLLFRLEPSIKQLIITTHYKGMASKVMKQFDNVKALKIIQTHVGSAFVETTKAEMTATPHDERYAEIMSFVERRTQDNKLDKLRLFIEDEMRQRYKLPLVNLNSHGSDTFNDCINVLRDNDYIEQDVATTIHGYRNTLNEPAHVLALWSLEDSRTYAEGMMEFIYSEL